MREFTKLLKALSHETRLMIMVLLSQKELCVCEIEKHLNLSQAKVSRHLTVLKHAGLVKDRREGLWIYYSAVKPENKIEKGVFELFRELAGSKPPPKLNLKKLKPCIIPQKRKKTVRKGGN